MIAIFADVQPTKVLADFCRGFNPATGLLIPLLVLVAFVLVLRRDRA